jgi:RNA polymerase sigma-70 factor (ECF subfamily)
LNEDRPQSEAASPPPPLPEQFMRLFLANQRRFYGLILSLVTNAADADDLLQEVSARMWQKFADFRPGTDFAAWGLRFARHEALNFLRKRRRAGAVVFNEELVDLLADEVAAATRVADARQEALLECLGKLPERSRGLIELRYEHGATPASIATRLGKSLDSVYKALNRIHALLVDCVEQALAREGRA